MYCNVSYGCLNHMFSLCDSFGFVEIENIYRRHFHTLTFIISISNLHPQQFPLKTNKKTPPLLLFYICTNTQILCTAV